MRHLFGFYQNFIVGIVSVPIFVLISLVGNHHDAGIRATAQQMSQISKYHERNKTRQIAKTSEDTTARCVVFEVLKNNIPCGYIISETTDGRKPP